VSYGRLKSDDKMVKKTSRNVPPASKGRAARSGNKATAGSGEPRSNTEELETSKEELQLVNEELRTVNQELKDKVEEVSRANADLQTLMQATDIAAIFLDREMRIKRYTAAVTNIFNIIPSDVGRPLMDLTNRLSTQDIAEDIKSVLGTLHRSEREVRSNDKVYIARFTPYRSSDDVIEGVVISFIDITHRKQTELDLASKTAELYMIADSTPLILVRVGADLKYRFINAAGAALYGRPREEIVGKKSLPGMLGKRAVSALRPYIERVLSGESVEFETEITYPAAGERFMRITYVPERNAEGAVDGWMASIVDLTDVRRAQQAERESEARFRILSDTVPALAWFDDADGMCRFVNKQYLDFCGKTMDQITGDQWKLILHPEDAAGYIAAFAKAQKSRSPFRATVRVLRHDGEWRWIESIASPLFGDSGKYLGHVGISPDITDRIESEDRLRLAESLILASRNQMRLITDALPALISYVGANERYRFANRTYKQWFGLEPEDVIGRRVRDVFGAKAYRFLKPHIEEALGGKQAEFEGEVEYKDGVVRFVHGSYVPDIDDEGRVAGYFGVTMDVSALKRSEELLRSSEEKLSLIMETFTDYAIMSLDKEGRIESWNAGAEHIFGYTEQEMLGHKGDILFVPEDRERDVPAKEMRTARQKGRALDERWHMRKNGSRFYASGVMMPLYLGKKLSGYAKIATDLTERQRQAEALQRAHDELEIRVGERTRELAKANQALIAEANARSASEEHRIMLLRRLINSQEMERSRIARDIHDQLGQRLTALRLKLQSIVDKFEHDGDALPEDFTDLQSMAAGLDAEVGFLAWELRPAALDDLGLVDAIKNFVTEWSRHFGVEANFQPIKIGKARFDEDIETHLYRIAQEALNNISKHSRATKVSTVLEKRGDQLLLIIEDNGIGFDPEQIKTPQRSGRGLGILGMRERTALVGGEFDIEATPGTGTTVYVRVPAFG
jgi:two-component system, chemotaxis family, CheB/CheR fusion protein